MPMTKIASVLSHNVDAGLGAVLGGAMSLGLATGAQMPDGMPQWAGWLASLGVALAPLLVKQIMVWRKGEAAGDRIRAAKKRAKADKCRKAGNEAEAIKLEDQADELEAQAAEHEAKARGGVE